jgi:hypothetical protein
VRIVAGAADQQPAFPVLFAVSGQGDPGPVVEPRALAALASGMGGPGLLFQIVGDCRGIGLDQPGRCEEAQGVPTQVEFVTVGDTVD